MAEHRSAGMEGSGQRSVGAGVSRWPRAAGLLFALATLGTARSGAAQEADLAIEWNAPSACPSLSDARGMLEAVIPPEVRERLEGTHVVVRLAPNEGGYRADIVVTRGEFVGERTLEGRRCDDVARSAIIVISVALTEAVEAAPDPVPPDPIPIPDPVPVPDPIPTPEPAPTESVDDFGTEMHVEAGLSAVTGIGSAFAAPRIEAAARWTLGSYVELGARVRAIPFAVVDESNARVGRVAVVSIAPEACVLASPSDTIHLGGCASLELGLMHGRGDSDVGGSRGNAGYMSLDVLPVLEIGRTLRLRLTLGIETRIIRPNLGIRGTGTVQSTPVVAGSAGLALVFVIP